MSCVAATDCFRTAWDTVRLSIALLIFLGVICSMTTKSLHRIFIWFAPINSMSLGLVMVIHISHTLSHRNGHHLHRTFMQHSGQATSHVGVHSRHRRLRLGFQALFLPPRLHSCSMDHDRLRWNHPVSIQLSTNPSNTSLTII